MTAGQETAGAADARILPVLLAGGSGTRLWPVSRDAMPKQFQPLVGPLSSFQQTVQRVADPALFADPLVITNEAFRFFVRKQVADLGAAASIVLEPERRDSAAAVAIAAVLAERRAPGTLVLALAADHIVLDTDLFAEAVRLGARAAIDGAIVVFGLTPTEPRSSFGYIKPGAAYAGTADLHAVDRFVEKPDRDTALGYMRDGYLWNSGNFLFRSDAMIAEFARSAPAILAAAEAAVDAATTDLGFLRLDRAAFAAAPSTSIDYAVIEKAAKIAVVTGRFRWSDIGSWDAIWEVSERDAEGNALHGHGAFVGSRDCLIHSEETLTTVVGLEGIAVIATSDAVMVVPRERAQLVKDAVAQLKAAGRGEAAQHRHSFRPWGRYDDIVTGDRFRVRHITVDPGGVLSLQKHLHRAEHWVVVSGTAEVTVGDDVRLVAENESLYIPVGTIHRLANPGLIPLELIEVQTGSHLSEDDVIRLGDIYSRM